VGKTAEADYVQDPWLRLRVILEKNQQRQRVDAKIKVSLQKCFRF